MNKHNKSLGKRSTNTAALSTAISNLKESVSPVIRVSSTRSNPRALKQAIEQWVQKTVRVPLSQPTTTAELVLTVNQIISITGLVGNFVQVRFLKAKVWNYTNLGTTTNYILVSSGEDVMETKTTTSVDDVGSGNSLPGVELHFPRTIAANFLGSSTFTVLKVRSIPFAGGPPSAQSLVADVTFEYKLTAGN
jgi:hypothetical protein